MKRNNRIRTRTLFNPVKIELSDAEIMADLQYPDVDKRSATARPSGKRNLSR